MRPQSHRAAVHALASVALAALLATGCAPVAPEARPGATSVPVSPRPSHQPAPEYAPASAMAAIARRGTLRVATRDSRPRLALTDPFTGELSGYEVDLAGLLAQRLLGTAEHDSVEVRAEQNPLDALREGRADLVLAGVDREDVPADLAAVGPYLEGARALLVPLDGEVEAFGDIADRRVCVGVGDAADLTALVDATAVEATSLLACGAAVGRGGLVAAFGDDLELFGVADAYREAFAMIPTGLLDVEYVAVVRPEARGLRDDVADALRDIVDSEAWGDAWVDHIGPRPPDPPDVLP